MRRFHPPKRGFRLTAWEPAEADLHRSVAQALDWGLLPPALYTTFPAGWGKLDKATAGRLKGSGLKPGFPDILAFYARRCVGIELKTARGVLSDDQKFMFPLIAAAGIPIHICRSVEDVIAALRSEGFPLRYAMKDPKGVESWLRSSEGRQSGLG